MKKILILIALVFFGLAADAQSKTVKQFEKDSEGWNLFLYQSLIRVLNRDKNPEFNMLIKDLDHIRFVTNSRRKGDGTVEDFFKLDKSVQKEGFEEIMTFDNSEAKCHLYEFEARGSKSLWVATFYMDGMTGVLEMKGALNLKYLHAFNSLNIERLEEMLPIDRETIHKKRVEKDIEEFEEEEGGK